MKIKGCGEIDSGAVVIFCGAREAYSGMNRSGFRDRVVALGVSWPLVNWSCRTEKSWGVVNKHMSQERGHDKEALGVGWRVDSCSRNLVRT